MKASDSMGKSFGLFVSVPDVANFSSFDLNWLVAAFWIFLLLLSFYFLEKKILNVFHQWILPFCLLVFCTLFFKIIFSLSDLDNLKVLFYPDFSSLKISSLTNMVGHALLCFFIGFGFYGEILKFKQKDPIDFFIKLTVQSLVCGLLVSFMALPLVNQVSETPLGLSFLFEILPRWLSYGSYGFYYSFLLFLSLSLLTLYLSFLCILLLGAVTNSSRCACLKVATT